MTNLVVSLYKHIIVLYKMKIKYLFNFLGSNISLSIFCLIVLNIIALTNSFSQKEGNIWYFGTYAGLDFNTNPPTALTNSAMNGYEGCASISDTAGKLLFYTDGTSIWNKRHAVMQNGTGLLGGNSSAQSAVIVPYPTKDSLYFVFTVPQNGQSHGLRYSIVNMNLDTGNGGVTNIKNVQLFSTTREKLTAVKHANGRDYWILMQEWSSNAYRAYQVTDTGVVLPPTRTVIGTTSSGWYTLKANTQGDKVATTHAITNPKVNVFDFNNSTGVLSNSIVLNIPGSCLELYGTEFSPNGRVLYAGIYNCSRAIYQWNLNAGNDTAINRSRVKLDSGSNIGVGTLQLATDGKIYIARDQRSFLSVINYPDVLDTCCAFRENGISLSGRNGRFGLPTIMQSFFSPPNPLGFNFSFDNQCVGDTIKVTATGDSIKSVKFITGNQVDSGNIVKYVFNQPGVYEITMVTERRVASSCSNNFFTDTIRKKITIGIPKKVFPKDSIACDTFTVIANLDTIKYLSFKWSVDSIEANKLIIKELGKYWVDITDSMLCKYSDTFKIQRFLNPDAKVLYDSIHCDGELWKIFNQSNNDPEHNIKYTLKMFDTSFVFSDSLLQVHMQDTGKLNVIFISSSKNCQDSIPFSIYNSPTPQALFTINNPKQCARGNHFEFTNQTNAFNHSLNYLWNYGNGDTTSATEPNYSYSTFDTFYVSLEVTNINLCKSIFSDTIYVDPNPVADFNSSDSLLCFNYQSYDFISTAIVSKGNISQYYWNLDAGKKDSISNVMGIKYDSIGSYSIVHIVTSSENCKDTIQKTIEVKRHPDSKFEYDTLDFCLKLNEFNLIDSSTHNVSHTSIWEIPDLGRSDTTKNITYSFLENGKYDFRLIVFDQFGCEDTSIGTITVHPQSQLAFDTDTVCLRDSLTLLSKSTVSSGDIASWEWNLGNGQSGNGEEFTFLYPATGNYDISLYTNTDKNCKDTLTRYSSVLIRPLPAPLISAVSPICENFNLQISNNTADTGQHTNTNYFLDWYGTQQLENDKTFERLPLDTGVQQLNFIAVNQFGCRDSTLLNFRIIPEPKADFFFPFRLQCLRGNIFEPENKTINYNYSVDYFWDFGGTNTFTIFEPVISFPDIGIYPMYLTVTNNYGCVSTIRDTLEIDFFPIPTIIYDLNADSQCLFGNEFVFANSSVISNGTFDTYVGFADLDTFYFGDTLSVKLPQAGLYNFDIFINSDLQCKDTVTAQIMVWEMPVSDFIVSDPTGCEGQSKFIFTNQSPVFSGVIDFIWKYDNIVNTDSIASLTYVFPTEGFYTAELIAITENNCRDTFSENLIINPVPIPQISVNTAEQCFNNQVYDFYSTSTLTQGTYESFWTLDELGAFNQDSVLNRQFLSIGIKTINYKAVSDSGCADSLTIFTEVFPNPLSDFSLDTHQLCFRYNVFNASSFATVTQGSIAEENWFVDAFDALGSGATIQHSFADSGIHWFRLEVVSDKDCKDTFSRSVQVYQNPVSAFSAVLIDSCFYDHELEVNSQAYGFGQNLTSDFYISDNSQYLNSIQFNKVFADFDTFSIEQIVTDEFSCADTSVQQVIVRPQPLAQIKSEAIQECLRINRFVFTDSTLSNGVNYSREWEIADGSFFSHDSILPYSYGSAGNKSVYLRVNGPFGCTSTDSLFLTVLPKNYLDYTFSDSVFCFNEQELSFAYTGSESFTYLDRLWWHFGDGSVDSTASGSKLFADTGFYSGMLISLNPQGCYDTLDFRIEIKPNPFSTFVLNDSVWCFRNQELIFTSTATTPKGNIATWEWDFGDGSASTNQIENNKQYTASGSYQVRHVVVNDIACSDTSYQTISLFDNPVAQFSSTSFDECFKGNTFTMNSTSTFPQTASQQYWLVPNDAISDSGAVFNFSISKPGQFEFSLVAVDNLGCADTTFGLVTVHHQTKIDFEVDTVCFLEYTNLRSLSLLDSGTIDEYKWHLGDGQSAFGSAVKHEYANSGLYSATHVTTTNFGCKDTLTKTDIVLVRELPEAEFDYAKVYDSLKTTGYQFTNQSNGEEPLSFNWQFDFHGVSNEINPYFEFNDTGSTKVTLITTDYYGCENSIEKYLIIFPNNQIFIPTAFSPNGDGLNEIFKPEGMAYVNEYKMEIFNRWGELIFVSKDLNVGWDGTYRGQPVHEGVYLYKITILDMFNQRLNKDGMLTILK
jgi:gliding motility-associated-like protein